MLSDRDRATLDDIQQRLVTEDPQFTGAFDRQARGLTERGRGARRTTLSVLLVIASILTALMIVVNAVGPALFFTAVACWLIWLRWGRPLRDRHQGP
jgi:Flp pilus assembly protein TadB